MKPWDLDAIVDHNFMASVRVQTDIRCGNVVCVADVKVFIDLQFEESDHGVIQSIGEAESDHIVEDEHVVNVKTQRSVVLNTYEC